MNSSQNEYLFNFYRFKLVVNRFFVLNRKNWSVGLLGAGGILFSIWMIPVVFGSSNVASQIHFEMIEVPAMFLLALGGMVITSHIFHEIHSQSQAFRFLTLPATNFEKFAGAWFITSVAFLVVVLVAIFLLSVIIEIISAVNYSNWNNFKLFNPFQEGRFESYGNYFLYHSIYLLGAIYFKKNNFLKTVLAIILFILGAVTIIGITGFFYSFVLSEPFSVDLNLIEQAGRWGSILRYAGNVIITALFLLFGYLQLKNKQVA